MQCDTYQLWLSAYLDGELSAVDLRALEFHLDACSACTGELATLRGSVRLLRGLPLEDPPAQLRPRILAAIATSRPSTWSRLAALFRLPAPVPAWSMAGTGLAAALVVGAYCVRPASEAPSRSKTPKRPSLARARHPATTTAKRPSEQKQRKVTIAEVPREPVSVEPAPEVPAVAPRHEVVVTRTAKAGGTPRSMRLTLLPVPRHPRREESRRAMKPAPRRTGPPAPATASSSGMDGFESPAPRVSAMPPAPATTDAMSEEPMTMMASMPMVSSGMPMEATSPSGDALESLRERLAEQRRAVPTPAVDPPVSKRDARTLPVRIEF